MNYEILNHIENPSDLKDLDQKKILKFNEEIRDFLVESVSKNGGHLASNLGAVELTVALHKVFDHPRDHVIFDVGHQSYVHKILTGRKGQFEDLRIPGGLSGFTTMKEGDCFGTGHSSTSISAALGFAEGDKLAGRDNFTVAVVGDGAFTGGMVHEAINNCTPDLKLIIILNENRMSISKNKGAFASYLAKVRISKSYLRMKKNTNSILSRIPLVGKPIQRLISFIKDRIKRVVYSNNYFEELGLYYVGPVDGNDYSSVERALLEAKRVGKCSVVHVFTKKGKGYAPAEENPSLYHGISASSKGGKAFHEAFSEYILEEAGKDDKLLAVTAAMGIGTGLEAFEEKYPKRYFDVGIAEEHALTFAAGLAASGYNPFVGIYSTFLQRGYDNLLHDIALQNLGVKIIIDRAGLSPSDGPTHHGIFDVAFLSHIPGMRIYAPATYKSLKSSVRMAALSKGPLAIRYPNASEIDRIHGEFYKDGIYDDPSAKFNFDERESLDLLFVTYGNIISRVFASSDNLALEGVKCGILLCELLKPNDKAFDMISRVSDKVKGIIFVEEGIKNGGFSMILKDKLTSSGINIPMEIIAIDDNFASPCKKCDLYDYLGLTENNIVCRSLEILNKKQM